MDPPTAGRPPRAPATGARAADGGRVREVGSHAELLAIRGLYAELYALQARAYRT